MMLFSFNSKKFTEPLNTTVYTTTHVVKEKSPITLISHELDGDWQFLGDEIIKDFRKVIMLVSLGQVIKLDKSILKVADLPLGHQATRKSRSDNWVVTKIEYSAEEMSEFGFHCSGCGKYHKQIPMAYGADAPSQYSLIQGELRERCILTQDQCIIEGQQFFIKGRIELRVDNKPGNFSWNTWVQLDEKDFKRITDLWEDENRILENPYEGKIATHLPPYPETIGLPVKIFTQQVGYKPLIELYESNHPLYLEQENGITMERVIAFAKEIMYNH